MDKRTRVFPDLFLVLGAETWSGVCVSREHPEPAPPFKSVTPKELRMALLEVPEPGNVEPAGPSIIESARLAGQVLHEARHARTHDVLAEVVAYVAAGVSNAVRIKARFGEQHEPRRFERRSGQEDDLGLRLVSLEGFRVDERDAAGLSGVLVYQNFARDGIGSQREVARLHRRVDQSRRRVEGRMDITASGPAAAGAPPVTPAAKLVVLQAVRRDSCAIRGQDPPHLCDALAQPHFRVVQLGRTLEEAVGQVRQIFVLA